MDAFIVNFGPGGAVDDPVTGQPYAVNEDDQSAAAFVTEIGATILAHCWRDPGSDVIVGFAHYGDDPDTYWDEEYPAVAPVIDSLVFAGEGTAVAMPTSEAPPDQETTAWTSATSGYRIAWDPASWTQGYEDPLSAEFPYDTLRLYSDRRDGTYLDVYGWDPGWANAEDCVDRLLADTGLELDGVRPLTDPSTGEGYAVRDDDRFAVAYLLEDGATTMFDCRRDPVGNVVVGSFHYAGITDDYFGDHYPAVVAALDSLTFAEPIVPTVADSGADAEAGTYISPTAGYVLAWDPNVWRVGDEAPKTPTTTSDDLTLIPATGTGHLLVSGAPNDWSDTDDCVASLADRFASRMALDDPDTGAPYVVIEDDRSAAAYVSKSGAERSTDEAVLIDCRQEPGGGVIVAFVHFSPDEDDYFTQGYPALAAIMDTLQFAERGATPDSSDRASTPTSDRDGPQDAPAGFSPSGAATPRGTASPPASAADSAVGADPEAGTYTSPTYGYSVSWDPDEWNVAGEDVGNGDYPNDLLELSQFVEGRSLNVSGGNPGWSNPDDCVADVVMAILAGPVSSPVNDPETDEPYAVSEDDRAATAFFAYGSRYLIECRQDPGSTLVIAFIHITGATDDYWGDLYPAAVEVMDSLAFPMSASGGSTPPATASQRNAPPIRY